MKSRTFEEVLFAGFNSDDWYFTRFLENDEMFLTDQLIAYNDSFNPEFNTAVCRDIVRHGYHGYTI